MPTSDSTRSLPPCPVRHADRLTPQELATLKGWAAELWGDRHKPRAVRVMAACLCYLIGLCGGTPDPEARASVDLKITNLLADLAQAGLAP